MVKTNALQWKGVAGHKENTHITERVLDRTAREIRREKESGREREREIAV